MRVSFNLIVTHEPGYENYLLARSQLYDILGSALRIVDVSQSIILAMVPDPYDAVRILKDKLPSSTTILRIIPVDIVTEPVVDKVAEAVKKLALERIGKDESFKIRVDGHLYEDQGETWRLLHKKDSIEKIAAEIDRKVDLSNPTWLIYIKVLKIWRSLEKAAIVVAKPSDIVSMVKRTSER